MSNSQLKILFACSELSPWIKTGGLADVCGSLPVALHGIGADIKIVLPGYHSVLEKIEPPVFIELLELSIGTVTLCQSQLNGLDILLINHESFSNRPGDPYMSDPDRPWPDNAYRFALFSQAVCAIACNRTQLRWQPDVVHCHDWQTGLVPALLSLEPRKKQVATVFTIHNLAYQGNISFDEYHQLQLPNELLVQDGIEFWGKASFIKGGLAYADRVTTVSQTYAEEITTTAFGCGMEGMLLHRSDRLSGILNGIDTEVWNPSTDPLIAKTYNIDSIENKAANKLDLQRTFKLNTDPDTLLFGVISRLAAQKGIDVIIDAVTPLLSSENIQLVALGSGDTQLQQQLLQLKKNHPGKVAVNIGFSEPLSHQVEAGADVFLMPSRYEPCGLNQMYSHRYGTLPVVTRVGGLADTVIDHTLANGNGFVIDDASADLLQQAMQDVVRLFKQTDAWLTLQSNAMHIDYSWNKSASLYLQLYSKLLDN